MRPKGRRDRPGFPGNARQPESQRESDPKAKPWSNCNGKSPWSEEPA